MSAQIDVLINQIDEYAGLSKALFQIQNAMALGTDQIKSYLDPVKGSIEKIKGDLKTDVTKYYKELLDQKMPESEITQQLGNHYTSQAQSLLRNIERQYPFIGSALASTNTNLAAQGLGGIQKVMPGTRAAPKRRTYRRRTTTAAPRRRTTTVRRRPAARRAPVKRRAPIRRRAPVSRARSTVSSIRRRYGI